ncbi:MAG TPA: hypothetical protein VLG44_05505 [Chlamydiales bacterium]|nr:hypothetical protein [Chlamydiales bacterium]
MSGEINAASVPITFDGSTQSIQMLIDFLQNNSTFLPPALLSAFLMQYLFTFPAQFPSMGQRQLVPMPEVQEMQRQINKTLEPIAKELEKSFSSFQETLSKTFPLLKLAKGEKLVDFLPAFKALVRDLALLEPSDNKPTENRGQLPSSQGRKAEPAQPKIPDMVGKAKLATEYLHHSHENTSPADRFLEKLSNFMGHFQSLLTEAQMLFPHEQNTVNEMRDSLRHLEKAFTMVKERTQTGEGAELAGNKNEPIVETLKKEFGKFLQDAFRPFRERTDAQRGEIRFMASPKESPIQRGVVFNHNPRPQIRGEQVLGHFLKLFITAPQAAPNVHQEGVPLGILAPYSQNQNQDLKKKTLKEKKKEPRNRPYLRDLPYEEELE